MANQDSFSITLTQDEALVLLEMFADFGDQQAIVIRDQAERRALWNLGCLLEKAVPHTLSPGYGELVKIARTNLSY